MSNFKCSTCGDYINNDEALHCATCGNSICGNCGAASSGICSHCYDDLNYYN